MPKVYNKRQRGVPKDAIYVGRPSKWGNPFLIGRDGNRDEVLRLYRRYLIDNIMTSDLCAADLRLLRGKDLVCDCSGRCAPLSCHADVLLELTNR